MTAHPLSKRSIGLRYPRSGIVPGLAAGDSWSLHGWRMGDCGASEAHSAQARIRFVMPGASLIGIVISAGFVVISRVAEYA
jgi:hypothetical protein